MQVRNQEEGSTGVSDGAVTEGGKGGEEEEGGKEVKKEEGGV